MKLKKCISVMLCLILCVSMVTTANAQQIDDEHLEAITVLDRLSMLSEKFSGEKEMTFGEFVSLAMSLRGVNYQAAEGEKSPFKDVATDDDYYGAIKLAYDMGIISGYGDGMLGYDEKIKTDRAVKILISILGYDHLANSYGGWPSGYLVVGTTLGVLKKCTLSDDNYIKGSIAAQLVYNCLEIDIAQQIEYPDKKFVTIEGENPLTEWLHYKKTTGTVMANQITTLGGSDGIKEGYVLINSDRFLENGVGIADLLGYVVEVWYKEVNGENVLMYGKARYGTKTEVISADDIAPETSGLNFYYYKDGYNKTFELKIAGNANFIYNFKSCSSDVGTAHLKPANGSVTLTDTNGDGVIDVVNIKDSVTYVVKEINVHNKIISDLYGQSDLRLGDKNVTAVIKKDNVQISLEEVMENNVLTVSRSGDGKYIEIIVGVKKAKGIADEKGNASITVSGREYKILSQNSAKFTSLTPGEEITLLLDANLKAAGYIKGGADDMKYGYLIIGEAESEGLSKDVTFRIFTVDDGVKGFVAAENISVDGKIRNALGERLTGETLVNEFKDGGVFTHQLIMYETNEDGKLYKIITAKENCAQSGGNGAYDEAFSHDFSYRPGDTRLNSVFYKTGGLFGAQYNVENSIGITVPSDDIWAGGNLDEIEKSFARFTPSVAWGNDKRVSKVDIYDVSETFRGAVVIDYGAGGSVLCGPEFMLVEKVSDGLDDEGYPAVLITGMYDGEYQKLVVNTESDIFKTDPSLLKLQSGDVIRIAKDALGRVVNLIKVFTMYKDKATGTYAICGSEFDAKTGGENSADVTSYTHQDYCDFDVSAMNAVHATAYFNDIASDRTADVAVKLGRRSASAPEMPTKIMRLFKSNIYLYDERTKKARLATHEEIYKDECKTVVIRSRYANAEDLIIIDWEKPVTNVYWTGGYDK